MVIPTTQVAQTCEPNSQPYNYLKAPGEFSLSYIQGTNEEDSHESIDKVGTYYVRCENVRICGLPLDPDDARAANPRAPDNDAGVVSDMRSQLVSEPGLFHVKNGGISIVCAGFEEIGGNSLKVEIIEGDGIINGGHTYYSIMSMVDGIAEEGQVKIDFIQLDSDLGPEERKLLISHLAIARNKNRELTAKSTANYLGFYDKWKDALGESVQKSVLWKEGEQDSANIIDAETELIPLLWGMEFIEENFHMEYNSSGATPMQFGKSMHKKWYNEVDDENEPLEHMLPYLQMLLQLREYIGVEMHENDMNGRNAIPLRNLSHMVAGRSGPNSTILSTTTFRTTNFANWLQTGTVKGNRSVITKKSVFGGHDINAIPNTVRDILMGNFRSVMWYKIDINTSKVVTGWITNPFTLWKRIKVDVVGALLNQFNNACRQDPKVFVREDTIKYINLLEWGNIKWDYATNYPSSLTYGGEIFFANPRNEGQKATLWAKNDDDPDFIEFFNSEASDLKAYYPLVASSVSEEE